jgi:hypothetical protein
MRSSRIWYILVLICGIVGLSPLRSVYSSDATVLTTVSVRTVVTAETGKERDQVTGRTPYQNDHADLQLFLLTHDGLSSALGTHLNGLRKFVSSQLATTAVGVAYMRNATVQSPQNPTNNHALAANAIRLPPGNVGAYGSLYLSLADLSKGWSETPVRGEVVMVSDGIDRFGGTGPLNPYVSTAIDQAQRGGIVNYAIYETGVGFYGRSLWRIDWRQSYLSQVANETGGDFYFEGLGAPVSFEPFLQDINRHLNHQYDLQLLARPGKTAGLQPLKLRTEESNVDLAAADRVYVPLPAQ